MNIERVEAEYRKLLGDAALERQQRAAKEFWVCCGNPRSGPHHEACSKYVEPPPEVHDDQASLL